MTGPSRFVVEYDPAWWMARAACRGEPTSTFFPTRGDMDGVARALSFCHGTDERPPCPVMGECLRYAIKQGLHAGVMGGMSERGRRKWRSAERRRRNLERATPLHEVI